MPLVRISTRTRRTPAEKEALLDAVHAALVEALRVPEYDRNQRLHEYEEADFEAPPGRTSRYTLVEITLFAGRSPAAKKALFQALVRNLGALGIEPMDVFVVLTEAPLENWGIRGGVPASEVNLGFKVDV